MSWIIWSKLSLLCYRLMKKIFFNNIIKSLDKHCNKSLTWSHLRSLPQNDFRIDFRIFQNDFRISHGTILAQYKVRMHAVNTHVGHWPTGLLSWEKRHGLMTFELKLSHWKRISETCQWQDVSVCQALSRQKIESTIEERVSIWWTKNWKRTWNSQLQTLSMTSQNLALVKGSLIYSGGKLLGRSSERWT